MSDSVRPQRQQPTWLHRPRDSPGKNNGVGCHFLLQCMKAKSESEVAQSCLTLSDPMDRSPLGLLPPWDFPGKSTGVGCYCLLWHLCAWNWKPLNQQVPGSHSDWGSWRKATALHALWVPGEVLRAKGFWPFPCCLFGFSSSSLPLTHCLSQ